MAKKKDNKSKNSKKEVSKKIEKLESNTQKEILQVIRIFFAVMVVFAFFYLLTVVIVGNDEEDESELETEIQYEEILAGSSFTMRDEEYLVVYYDFTSEDASDIGSAIYAYSTSYTEDVLRVYTVDMSNAFNKKYASDEKSNEAPESATDLLINGPTIIRIKDSKAIEYIDELEDVLDYLQ